VRPEARKTLLYSILDAVGYSVMVGAGETYFIPYAIYLEAQNWLLALFIALPIFVGSLTQVFSERLLRFLGSRKSLICWSVVLQILTFIPMALVHEIQTPWRPHLLLAVICLYWACGLVSGPSWSSLMGDLVPEEERGAYFGRRNRYIQVATFCGFVMAGVILYLSKQRGVEFTGYVWVFALSALARGFSLVFLLLHWDPPFESPPTPRTLSAVKDTFKNKHQRALILYLTTMNLAVYMAAPFFSAFMLKPREVHGLAWSYVSYTVIQGVAFFFKFVFFPLWGMASDRFGSRKCLVLAAWLVCGLPIFWLFPRDDMALYFGVLVVAQMCSGLSWAGHELASFNFLLDSARPADRPHLVAAMNILNGFMVFLGSGAGAILVTTAPGQTSPFLLVFLVSSLARFVVCAFLVHRLREVRVVDRISYRSLFFRIVSVRAQMGSVLRFFVLPHKGK
jgi:MFS family permease